MSQPQPDRFTIEYELTEDMAERLGRIMLDQYFYGHAFHRFAPLVLIGILGGLIAAFYLELLTREIFGFFLVVLATLCGYAWFRRLLLFQNARWAALFPLQGQSSLKTTMSISSTLLSMHNSVQDYEAEWEELAAVWIVSDFWILRLKTGIQFVLPAEKVTPELEQLIRTKATQLNAAILE